MVQQRRIAKNTVAGHRESLEAAKRAIEPSSPLPARARILFDNILEGKERSCWNKNDVWLATRLAVMCVRLEEVSAEVDEEGFTIRNDRGTMVANPKFAVMEQTIRSIQSLNRLLGLSAGGRGQNSTEQKQRNASETIAKNAIEDAQDESLLA